MILAYTMPLITHFTPISTDEADNAVRMTSNEFKPTLRFLRNSDIDKHSLDLNMDVKKKKEEEEEEEEETAESDLDVENLGVTNTIVKALFNNFTVKFVNICRIQAGEVNTVERVLEHYRLREDDP